MAKLTSRQKKQIIAEAAAGATVRDQAKKYGVSHTTIVRVRRSDPSFSHKVTKKREQLEESVLDHMEKQVPQVNMIIDDLLKEISNKDKQKSATIVQLATVVGILTDKFTIREQRRAGEEDFNNLMTVLSKTSAKEDVRDIPELQPKAESVDAVVEDSGAKQ